MSDFIVISRQTTLALSITLAFGLAGCGGGGSSGSASAGTAGTNAVADNSASSSGTATPVANGAGSTSGGGTAGATGATGSTGTGSGTTSGTSGTTNSGSGAGAPTQSVSAPATTVATQPVPTNIADGSVVQLACGTTYVGTLNLSGKSNVTVQTSGSCGNAIITPGQPITGWTQYQGNIYSAPIPFTAAQVIVDGQPQPLAHWPSTSQTWATASGSSASSLSYAMPNADLSGATLVFRSSDWYIGESNITGYSGNTMTLAANSNPSFDGYSPSGQTRFYVEGKLWMLDEPGEWAVSGGRLYLWAPDGKTPEGRVWASPASNGINAGNSSNVVVRNVSIFGAANGIEATGATKLQLSGVQITDSSESGVVNSGGSGLSVDGSTIRNTRHDAIIVKWGGGGEQITNSTVDASGTIGMPTNARAAIDLTSTDGAHITGNSVTHSGYIAIRAFRNAVVSQNKIDSACLVLTDCGGIYVSAPDQKPLNTLIDSNTITNVGGTQTLAWAVDLDDASNAVTLSNNTISGNANGLQINNGYNNTIKGNQFSSSVQAHIQMVESTSSAQVRNNAVTGNSFSISGAQQNYRLSSTLGASSVAQFGSYGQNAYTSSSSIFANFNGAALSFDQWKAKTGQDQSSTLNGQ